MSITAEGLRGRRRRARLSQDTTSVNNENHRQNGLSLPLIDSLRPPGLRTPWRSQPCSHCGTLLLGRESATWCCSGGHKILTPLPPLPARIEQLVADTSFNIARQSRELNYLFALSAIGVSDLTSGWSRYTGDANQHSNLPMAYSF